MAAEEKVSDKARAKLTLPRTRFVHGLFASSDRC
jgi:hypothetical protein